MLSETKGVSVLTEAFRRRGYGVENDVPFDEDGVAFSVDGWDAAARVGFEYRTHEASDKEDLTDDEIDRLGARIARGELFLLIVDDRRVPDAETMALHAERFLDQVELVRGARKPAKKTVAKKRATTKTTKTKKKKKQTAKVGR